MRAGVVNQVGARGITPSPDPRCIRIPVARRPTDVRYERAGHQLITNLAVTTHAEAAHKLEWYALRWKIETFFRTLKTGCRIENVGLATADRLANCIALCCVVAWRVSWLTMLSRAPPGTTVIWRGFEVATQIAKTLTTWSMLRGLIELQTTTYFVCNERKKASSA